MESDYENICGDPNDPTKVTLTVKRTVFFEGKTCTLEGIGTYNNVYTYFDDVLQKTMVLKIPRNCDAKGEIHGAEQLKLDNPERAVRLWNAINPEFFPPAKVVEVEGKKAWICPYIEGTNELSAEDRCQAVIKIFNQTGRIIIDAPCDNFIKTADGKIVCIDVGFLLQLEKRDIRFLGLTREKSETSLSQENLLADYIKYFENTKEKVDIKLLNLLKALIIIKLNRPDTYDVSFLENNFTLVEQIAKAYSAPTNLPSALKALDEITAMKESKQEESKRDPSPTSELELIPTLILPKAKTKLRIKQNACHYLHRFFNSSFLIRNSQTVDKGVGYNKRRKI